MRNPSRCDLGAAGGLGPTGWLLTVMLVAATLAGCKLFTDPSPICAEGRHVSDNRCCAAGEEWVPARNACVCLDRERCGGAASQTAELPRADAGAVPRGHACEGSWKGTLKTSEGHRGPLLVTITPVQPGTIDRPYGSSCGTVNERWGGDGSCRMRLTRCAFNGAILIATGSATESSTCEGPVHVAISCTGEAASYKHGEEDIAVRGTLTRAPAGE